MLLAATLLILATAEINLMATWSSQARDGASPVPSTAKPKADATNLLQPGKTTPQPGASSKSILPDSVFIAVRDELVSITLVDGVVLTGRILDVDAAHVVFSTEYGGIVLAIEKQKIATLQRLGDTPAEDGVAPKENPENDRLQEHMEEAEALTKRGLNWQAYAEYEEALDFAAPSKSDSVFDEMKKVEKRMRNTGLALWITGTALTVAGVALNITVPGFFIFGGFATSPGGIGLIIPGAIMHGRANRLRRELPRLKRRSRIALEWNGGLSWSF